MDYDRRPSSPSHLKSKLRSSICFSCCFGAASDGGGDHPPSLIRSSSTWILSKAQGIPDVRNRFINAVNRHRRHGSVEFQYDPLSYALNFDEGPDDDSFTDQDFRLSGASMASFYDCRTVRLWLLVPSYRQCHHYQCAGPVD